MKFTRRTLALAAFLLLSLYFSSLQAADRRGDDGEEL